MCMACHARTDPLLELSTLCRLRAKVADSLRVGGLHPLHVERAQHGLHTLGIRSVNTQVQAPAASEFRERQSLGAQNDLLPIVV
jgi:hypothetical protein